ncbi:uncharacterized protein CLUP02_10116 [Colletotrichum lupini]|uniref:Uncharacterized protein n=1 Tax=Colletotrichum lupini TaxID=145971 RepID=A0A9Q8SW48_9PEZI|nr:uncharacterized protein CLUP02_10116 [Colletotrichum lupini]UQC84619.1 hypothetical protein CLUP02_10116 [Colletotrichum lupini]
MVVAILLTANYPIALFWSQDRLEPLSSRVMSITIIWEWFGRIQMTFGGLQASVVDLNVIKSWMRGPLVLAQDA